MWTEYMYLNNVFIYFELSFHLAESGSSIWYGFFFNLTLKCPPQTCMFEHLVACWGCCFRTVETGRWQWVTGVGFGGLWSASASGQPQCQKQLPHAPASETSPLWWAVKVWDQKQPPYTPASGSSPLWWVVELWALTAAQMSCFCWAMLPQRGKSSTRLHRCFFPGLYRSLKQRENTQPMFWQKEERCKTSDYVNVWKKKSWGEPWIGGTVLISCVQDRDRN